MSEMMSSPLCRRSAIRAAVRAVLQRRTRISSEMLDRLDRRLRVFGARRISALRRWIFAQKNFDPRLVNFLDQVLAPDDLASFGDYVPLIHLADGGMGRVWLCAQPDGRLVVVKTVQCESCDDRYITRFEREARITCSLRHPHVVAAFGHGQTPGGELWLALEYIAGGDLQQLIARQSHLPELEALRIVCQAAEGLQAAHERNLVHRDLKPANIFLDVDHGVKVGDFGCARTTDDSRTLLTMEGSTLGTPAYMSPEQIRAENDIDIRTDIYALGVVLYACLCGGPPFTGQAMTVARAHLRDPRPDPSRLRHDLDPMTRVIVQKCMAKSPRDRYQTPAELIDALAVHMRYLGADPGDDLDEATITEAMPIGALGGDFQIPAESPASLLPQSPPPVSTTQPPIQTPVRPTPPAVPSGSAGADLGGDPLDDEPTLIEPRVEDPDSDLASMTLQASSSPDDALVRLNLQQACPHPWLRLDWQGETVLLWAATELLFGKQRAEPVAYCLRVYPVERERERCQMVSRQHFRLHVDAQQRSCCLSDVGSVNGTCIDGRMLNPQQAWPLRDGQCHRVEVPQSIELDICAQPQRTRMAPSQGSSQFQGPLPGGIDQADVLYDAVTIRRPNNRQRLHAALVQRRIEIGPPGSDLPLPLWRHDVLELAVYAGRWIIKHQGSWAPLLCGPQGSIPGLSISQADYDVFQ